MLRHLIRHFPATLDTNEVTDRPLDSDPSFRWQVCASCLAVPDHPGSRRRPKLAPVGIGCRPFV